MANKITIDRLVTALREREPELSADQAQNILDRHGPQKRRENTRINNLETVSDRIALGQFEENVDKLLFKHHDLLRATPELSETFGDGPSEYEVLHAVSGALNGPVGDFVQGMSEAGVPLSEREIQDVALTYALGSLWKSFSDRAQAFDSFDLTYRNQIDVSNLDRRVQEKIRAQPHVAERFLPAAFQDATQEPPLVYQAVQTLRNPSNPSAAEQLVAAMRARGEHIYEVEELDLYLSYGDEGVKKPLSEIKTSLQAIGINTSYQALHRQLYRKLQKHSDLVVQYIPELADRAQSIENGGDSPYLRQQRAKADRGSAPA